MKSFLTALIFLLYLTSVSAQNGFKKEFQFGISQGILLSQINFDPNVNQELSRGYAGGLIIRYITEQQLGIQVEINYLQKGWKENREPAGRYARHFEMLEIPFLTHFYAGKKTAVRFQFILGPYLGYYLSASEQISVADTGFYRDYYDKSIANDMEIGYLGGLSIAYRTKLGIFEFQGVYRHSLMNIFKAGAETFAFYGSRPQSIGITVNYLVRFGKR